MHTVSAAERTAQGLINAVPDAILGVDGQGLIRSASHAVASIFGREPADLCGQPLSELLPGLTAEEAEQRTLAGLFMRASQTHVARFETTALRHGGTSFPAEISLARLDPGTDEADPKAVRYACVVRDATDQKLLDEMLQLYTSALACCSNGVVISDLSLRGRPIIYVNAAYTRITGYEAHQAIGRNGDFLLGSDLDQPEIETLRRAALNGESCTAVLRNYRADGSLFFNELSIAPVKLGDGPPRHYVGILNDVTEGERTRLAIAERNARLSTVFDLSPDGFLVFDREGQLVYVNNAFLQMMEWEPGVIDSGLHLQELDRRIRAMADPAYSFPPLSMQADADGGFDTMDLLHLSQPRTRVLTRLARHNAGGQGESILYFRDVTHESEVDRMKSEFLTTAAHELRTPMVSVFGFTELLLRRPVPEPRKRDVLETIHRQASLLITMINDLLDLARIESRQGSDLKFSHVHVGELVQDTVDRMAGALAGHELRVELPASHGALHLWADGAKASQALTNVISNAIKYSKPGTRVTVASRLDEAGHRLGLVVQDQGIGMSQAQLDRVFERFYRADPSGNIPGTGLGMSLVKELLEQQGGEVMLSSEAGVGTDVVLWLPLATQEQTA